MTRRPVVPPDAPPVAVPQVSPALHKGTGTRAVGDRLRFWRAFAGLWLALWQLPPGVCWLLDAPWALLPFVLWEAAGAAVALSVGIAWVLLTFRQDLAQYHAMRDLWNVEITAVERGHATQRRVARAHARRWFRLPRQRERVIKVRVAGDVSENITPTFTPEPERDTRQLPALPPAPPPVLYQRTPLHIVVQALAVEVPCSERKRPGGLTKDAYRAAVAQLQAAGVVTTPGRGQGIALAPGFARYAGSPGLLDQEVARVLGAVPPSPAGSAPRADGAP